MWNRLFDHKPAVTETEVHFGYRALTQTKQEDLHVPNAELGCIHIFATDT